MTEATLLHRQVNPSWVQQGRVTSQLFKPTPKDNLRTSVYDGDQITAQRSWSHYTSELKFSSSGVLSVIVAECTAIDLKVEPDPNLFPEHAVIRFDMCTSGQIEKKSKRLRDAAMSRDWQYTAES